MTMGVILDMSLPVLLKTTALQALLVLKAAPKEKASEVGLIIIINEVLDHYNSAMMIQGISGRCFLHVFDEYFCNLYNSLWIPLSVCVKLSTKQSSVCVNVCVPHTSQCLYSKCYITPLYSINALFDPNN